MKIDTFEELTSHAENADFTGWDVSYLTGRWAESFVSWDYRQIVTEHLHLASSLLDMGTGGGEFLASLNPLPRKVCATEAYEPNVAIAKDRLNPLGVVVFAVEHDEELPFPEETFDLIINRHESFVPYEVARILRHGGMFITQQVGGQDNITLNRMLQYNVVQGYSDWSLSKAAEQLRQVGFTISREEEEYPDIHFLDVGAVIYYLKVIRWQIPDFSVQEYQNPLRRIDDHIRQHGRLTVQSHRFLVVAEKP